VVIESKNHYFDDFSVTIIKTKFSVICNTLCTIKRSVMYDLLLAVTFEVEAFDVGSNV